MLSTTNFQLLLYLCSFILILNCISLPILWGKKEDDNHGLCGCSILEYHFILKHLFASLCFNFSKIVCVYLCVDVWTCVQLPSEVRGARSNGARVIDKWEKHGVDPGTELRSI